MRFHDFRGVSVKIMKEKMIRASKISLFFVVLGFFMPVSCNCNGFQLVIGAYRFRWFAYALLMALVFVAAVVSICITFFRKSKLYKQSLVVDWLLLLTSILGGFLSIGMASREYFKLQIGAWFIIMGWILSLIFLMRASTGKEKESDNIDIDKSQSPERQDGS